MPPMIEKMLQPGSLLRVAPPALAIAVLLLLPQASRANLPSGFIDFSGTLQAGTCDLLGTSTVNLNNVDVLPILANPNGWGTAGNGNISIDIANCTGNGGALQAGVALSGTLSTDPGISGNTSLFKTGGESKGFGVVFTHNNVRLSQGSVIPATVSGTSGTRLLIGVAVSGGEKSWAGNQNQNMKAGSLTAAVTFTFGYR